MRICAFKLFYSSAGFTWNFQNRVMDFKDVLKTNVENALHNILLDVGLFLVGVWVIELVQRIYRDLLWALYFANVKQELIVDKCDSRVVSDVEKVYIILFCGCETMTAWLCSKSLNLVKECWPQSARENQRTLTTINKGVV